MKRIIPIIIILVAVGGGYWWYTQQNATALNNPAESALVGSGTIEADTLAITAELGGRITKVLVDEGDDVATGQTLIQLDTSDLLARQAELEALIATARANLELASAPPRPEDVRLAEAQLAQAEQVRDGAKLVWEQAQQLARDPLELDAQINQAKAQINQAEKNLENARVQLKRAEIQAEAASRNQSNNAGLAQNEAAQLQLQAAQQGVTLAEMAVSGAQKQVSLLQNLRDRPLSLLAQVNAAEAAYNQTEAAVLAAQANLTAAKANPTPEDVNIARAQLAEAETGLDVLAVQLEKQTLTAPRAGRISQKLVNPGEMAAPGLILLELRDLSTVDLTVYIPETQIGRVQLGQKANVQVDAYPAETFAGRVSFIAHQAEFTPKNVQTQEERVNLVFAVKITLDNPDGRLKPGMPADAEITADMWDGPLPGGGSAATQAQSPGQNTPPPTPTPTATPTPKPTATPLPRPSATPAPTATPEPDQQAEVTAFAVRVRSGPGLDFELVSHLNQGDVVPVLATDPDTGWLQIQLPNSDTGWITGSSTFVTLR